MEIDSLGDGSGSYGDGLLSSDSRLVAVDEQVRALGLGVLLVANQDHPSSQGAAGFDARVSASYSWGGGEESAFSVGAQGKAHDSRGNYVDLSAQQHSNGRATVEASAGYGYNTPAGAHNSRDP